MTIKTIKYQPRNHLMQIILILILSFLERQKKRTRINDQSNPLHGLFGFVVPLDLIGAFNNRWTYGFAFGSIANTIIVLFDEGFLPAGVPGWAKGFVILAGALEVGLCYFPIFACLTTANKIVGPIIGFLYTLFWLSVTVADIVICPHETAKRQYEKIISHWPSILCFLFLLYRFVYTFICRNKPGEGGYKDQNLILQAHQAEHVRRLLRKPVEKHKSWFERNIYTWDPCFKFPNRIIGTTVLALFCLYILITQEFNGLKMIIQMLKSIHTETFRQFIQDFANAIHGVWYFATILSSLTTVSYIFHILACYR
ncbi:Hypothetical predicted protein [Pelobates cultripes]|uniref:Uncharacterized protein n=1 Tax=Pelobates cultripes TaxID=61616 RepID=A0AAD1W4S7_PELCU|nr:Hypothetical predicted protein [Pelobates cultripes]